MTETLEEIKARLEAATPGPFQPDEFDACIVRKVGGYAVAQFFPQAGMDHVPLYDAEANARLFINAAVDIAYLVVEVERLQSLLEAEQRAKWGLEQGLQHWKEEAERLRQLLDLPALEVVTGK